LKQKLGGRMCLAGGMQAVEGLILLPTSAPLEIPLSAHIVENYRAMFEAAAAYPAG
jgi:hypothetical protein